MCVAIPAKVLSIDGNNAKVDMTGNTYNVNIMLVPAQVGDYVLVHAGCAIEILKQDRAEEILALFSEIEDVQTNE